MIVHPNHSLTRWARIPPPRKTNQHPLKINGWFRCISYWKFVPVKRGNLLVLLTRGCLSGCPGKTAVDLALDRDINGRGYLSWSYFQKDPPMEGWTNLYGYGVFWGPKNNHWLEGSGFLGWTIFEKKTQFVQVQVKCEIAWFTPKNSGFQLPNQWYVPLAYLRLALFP